MPGHIESQKLVINFLQIQISNDQLFAVIDRFDNVTRVGRELLHWLRAPAAARFAELPGPIASQQTEIASFGMGMTSSSLSSGCPICLGSCPKRSSEQNQVLDQKLACITQDWKAVSKVHGSGR
jgi:hypothetical protein